MQTCVFLHVCIYPLSANSHNISVIYCTKVFEIFIRCKGYILGLCMGIDFAVSWAVVKCQHKE